jgi:putative transcriptional regulator
MTIENRIGRVMRERGLTPSELATRAGLAHNTALALYRGVSTRIDLPVLDRVCEVLGTQPGDLLIWTSEVPHRNA